MVNCKGQIKGWGMNNPKTIEYPQWYKRGGMLYNRDCLDANDPEQTYNYILREIGVDPELYGIEKPKNIKEEALENGILELEKENKRLRDELDKK